MHFLLEAVEDRDVTFNQIKGSSVKFQLSIVICQSFDISEQNDGISSEILPSFRTEAVEDRDVIFNQIRVS